MKKELAPSNVAPDAIIIDVLSDTAYEQEHIQNAVNISIYETAFAEKVPKQYPDKSTPLVIYGLSDATQEADLANDQLTSLGYTDVSVIKNGLVGWKAANLHVNTKFSDASVKEEKEVSLKDSRVLWTGRNIGNFHTGKVEIQKGNVVLKAGLLTAGDIILDMKTIATTDLSGEMAGYLVTHLKSSDFFEVEKFPEASIHIKHSKHIQDNNSKPTIQVTADLTIKGITKEINFDAMIREKEGKTIINAHFDIDRTEWNVKYGSETFFARLGMHIIDDTLSFDIYLHLD
ncbi:MAG: rhodanese-related sulfurtransferase [Candidatus Woesearchaeota archaeon]|jgi:rhodanese-related sulfurtransferase